jgi:drug/metabolite transporter (DMT)-like permease
VTTVLLALASAVAYGSSDFIGGLVSRRQSAWSVAVVVQVSSAVTALALALVLGGDPGPTDLFWAALGGVGSGVGVSFLFRGLGRGRMSVVAPVSAVGAALLPVGVSVVLDGWPSMTVALAVATGVPGIWLVSRVTEAADHVDATRATGLSDGLLAGLGFGLMFIALDQVGSGAGLWPVALSQATSAVAAALLATALRVAWWPSRPGVWRAAWAGPLGTLALLCFLLATQAGSLTVAALLSSLYPAATIVLAMVVLHEHIHRAQLLGLGLCGVTVALVAVG